ncbi:MAG TPA: Gfo/Idh/MocA family oxidoreductase [Opitutaceae bacterium]|nr:Gfo/Idh/MocA family oxidoreductase [Opitutaceae bacterium]
MPHPTSQLVRPQTVRPIVMIGAGGIVRDAHLPAYRLAGFPVTVLNDVDVGKAQALAAEFRVPLVATTLAEAVDAAPAEAVFDVAVPASALPQVLAGLPDGAAVLIQKPFGENLEQARALLELCHRKRLRASVNFQLRYAPYVAAARAAIARGDIGEVHDVEVRVTVYMPWHLWTFLERSPRVEILYHSIHYVDLIRSFLGDPTGVYARTLRHPGTPKLASTRTSIVLDYGDNVRANITTNHGHVFGRRHQESYVKWEGTRGAIVARLGLLLDYPRGEPDVLEMCQLDAAGAPGPWKPIAFQGSWYPHAFMGTMSDLMRYANGEIDRPPTAVEDAVKTMAVVEAAYQSSATGATPIPAA